MTELLAAIHTHWDTATGSGGSGLGTTIGPLYDSVQKPSAVMPYAVLVTIDASATSKYGGVVYVEPELQFTVRAVGNNAAAGFIEAMIAKFDEHLFTLSTKKTLNTTRLNDPILEPGEPGQDENGDDTYGWIVSYRFSTT